MKEYTAFISYNSTDKRWAHWLKMRLDKFSYKKKFDEKYPLRYVFLDKYNLGVAPLKNKGLLENLQKSTYLIVVCSPHTPISEYVKYEIEEFKRICNERGDDWKQFVLPIIVGTDAAEKCLPEQIADIKAVRVKSYWSLSKECAIAIIAAKMLSISNPDQIWNYLRRKQRVKIVFYVFISLIILLGGYTYWEFTRVYKKYYVDYISGIYKPGEHKDWAEGIGELTQAEAKSLNRHYRLEYKRIPLGKMDAGRWQLRRIVYANSFNFPASHEEHSYPLPRFPIEELHYSSDSIHRVESVYCYDTHHKLQQIKRINGEKLNKIDIQDFRSELAFAQQTLSGFDYPLFESLGNRYANITHFEIARNYKGQVTGMSFKANNGLNAPFMPDTRKNIAIVFDLDSIGRITECNYVTYEKEIIYIVTYKYDAKNQLVSRNLYNRQLKGDDALLVSTVYKRAKDKIEKFFIKTFDNTTKKVTYTYNGGMLKSVTTDKCNVNRKGNGMFIFDILEREETIIYEYNKKGFPEWIHYYDSNNQQVISKQITYTPDNYIHNLSYRKLVGENSFVLTDGPEGYCYIYNIYTPDKILEKSLCYQQSSKQKYYRKYEYNSSNKLRSILFTDILGNPINMGDFNKSFVSDDFEKEASAAYTDVYKCRNTNKKLFDGDTLLGFGHKFPMYEKYAKRELAYDAYGNVTAIKYYNKNLDCFYMIQKWILENGFVTQSIAFLVNNENYKYPFSIYYKVKKGEEEMPISDEFASMLIDLIFN